MAIPPWITALDNSQPWSLPLDNYPLGINPPRQLLPNSTLDNYMDNCSPKQRQLSLNNLALDNYPSNNFAPWNSPQDNCPSDSCSWIISPKNNYWNCFELSCFESKLHLSKASIVIGDYCKPLISGVAIFYIYPLMLCYWVMKLKQTFYEPRLELISSSTGSRLT